MILRDSIEIDDRTGAGYLAVRAHVGTTSIIQSDLGVLEELRAVIAPAAFTFIWLDPAAAGGQETLIRWRGTVYLMNNPPLVTRRNGRDHHYTLRIQEKAVQP